MTDLSLERVSKRYRIRQQSAAGGSWWHRLRYRMGDFQDFWAVRDVSFDVAHGEALGIIGHNGAGKSTLLKLLSGITAPSEGLIAIHGRIAALLEVGSGFHPELTGRENVFLSGSILGMKRSEIHAKLESIIEFSEVRPFIDTPVKRYSSGMYVRLGFSIAAHLEPEVLLLDEVLAVGDAAFQDKCKERILDLKRNGTTIVFISHDLKAVQNVCDRVLVMQSGRIVREGTPEDAIRYYIESASFDRSAMRVRAHSGAISVTRIACEQADGTRTAHISTGEPVTIRLEYIAADSLTGVQFDLYLTDGEGQLQCTLGTRYSEGAVDLPAGPGAIEFIIDEAGVRPGTYRLDVVVEQIGASDPMEWIVGCGSLSVTGGHRIRGQFYQPHRVAIASRVAMTSSRETNGH